MSSEGGRRQPGLRYQADETPPLRLTMGLGVQLALLTVAIPVLIPTAVMRIAGAPEDYLSWAAFAAVAISGAGTALQAVRWRRIGAGQVLVMGSSGAFIGVSIVAIAEAGPALLATLVVCSALLQLVVSERLALFRKLLTPAVSGTVIMLVPVTVVPIVFGMLEDVPEGSPAYAAPVIALATTTAIVGASLKGSPALRMWSPIIGIVAGAAVAGFFGMYDVDRIAAAAWFGLTEWRAPGLDLDFGPPFWALLPAFLLAALIGSIRTMSSCIAMQRVSWRNRRTVDFRSVQGSVTVDGMSNLLAGLAGTVPNTTYSLAAPLAEVTGVASRAIGIATGAIFLALVCLPKALAVVLAVPGPVVGAYLIVLMAMLFVIGMSMALQDGMNYRKGLIVGVSFWVGVGFQNDLIYPELVSDFAGGILSNGLTAGGLAAILMTWLVEASGPRPHRMETECAVSSLPEIREFLKAFAARNRWSGAMVDRLDAVAEETLLTLLRQFEDGEAHERPRRLRLSSSRGEGGATLEFVVAPSGENIQERLALLGDVNDQGRSERDVSIRLLQHLASSVRHQQYHDADIVTVQVKERVPDS